MFRKINAFLFMTSMILRSLFQLFVFSGKNLPHLIVFNVSKQYCVIIKTFFVKSQKQYSKIKTSIRIYPLGSNWRNDK